MNKVQTLGLVAGILSGSLEALEKAGYISVEKALAKSFDEFIRGMRSGSDMKDGRSWMISLHENAIEVNINLDMMFEPNPKTLQVENHEARRLSLEKGGLKALADFGLTGSVVVLNRNKDYPGIKFFARIIGHSSLESVLGAALAENEAEDLSRSCQYRKHIRRKL